MRKSDKKVLVAMSGGVDSSVAAYILKKQGYDCIGVTMRLYGGDEAVCTRFENDLKAARYIASMLDIPHRLIDLSAEFKTHVIDYFSSGYFGGVTPNPCVECNRHIKFGRLFELADEYGAGFIATGHYARVIPDTENDSGYYLLKKALDKSKDQSYVLYTLTQSKLSRVLLPLGELTKTEIRSLATRQGFINAEKSDSQDICFIPDGDYASFIEGYTGRKSEDGDFLDLGGNVIGRHKGLIRYTIGQRKGLGLAVLNPVYVYSKDAVRNTITVCEADGLHSRSLTAAGFNFIAPLAPQFAPPLRVKAKIRYNGAEEWAAAELVQPGIMHLSFDKPQRAVTPGQAAVLYDGDVLIGGGTIIGTSNG